MKFSLLALASFFSASALARSRCPKSSSTRTPTCSSSPGDLYLVRGYPAWRSIPRVTYSSSRAAASSWSGVRGAGGATAGVRAQAVRRFIREIGKDLYAWSFAHTVRVDKQDNIWVADKGSDMVIKFNPAGQVVMTIGRKQEASNEDTAPLKHPKPPRCPPRTGASARSPT